MIWRTQKIRPDAFSIHLLRWNGKKKNYNLWKFCLEVGSEKKIKGNYGHANERLFLAIFGMAARPFLCRDPFFAKIIIP